MPRPLSSALAAVFASGVFRPVVFVELHFVSGTVYVWSGVGDLAWNGHTWTGLGRLASISTIEDASTIIANGITLTCSGIDPTMTNDVLHEVQVGLPVLIYIGSYDDTWTLIADPITAWAGRMDQPQIDIDSSTAILTINCENRLVEMNTAVDRRYTNDDLRTIPLPVIAHVNYGPTEQADHYIVIHRRLDGESLEVIDGTSGRVQRFLVKRMGNVWNGYLLVPSPVATGRAVSLGSWALIAQLGLIAACTRLPRRRKFLIPGATDVGPNSRWLFCL